MSRQLAQQHEERFALIKKFVTGKTARSEIAPLLPSHIKPEAFQASVILAVQKDEKLQQCSRESLMEAVLDLARVGLTPNKRDAHLIPFNTKDGMKCQLIVDYKGLVDILLRNGSVQKIYGDVIREHDSFNHSLGEVLAHSWRATPDQKRSVPNVNDNSTRIPT